VVFFCTLTGFSQAMGLTLVAAIAGLQCNEYAEKGGNLKQSPLTKGGITNVKNHQKAVY
jgi:hypothetical protein